MAAQATSEILLELITDDNLPSPTRALVDRLAKGIKQERAAIPEQLQQAIAERDSWNEKYNGAMTKYDAGKKQFHAIKAERDSLITRLENAGKFCQAERKRVGDAEAECDRLVKQLRDFESACTKAMKQSGDVVAERDRLVLQLAVTKAEADEMRKDLAHLREKDKKSAEENERCTVETGKSRKELERLRGNAGEHKVDNKQSLAGGLPVTPRTTRKPSPPSLLLPENYRPRDFTPPMSCASSGSSTKRKRSRSPSPSKMPDTKKVNTGKQASDKAPPSTRRKPVCGSCHHRNLHDSCDGETTCSRCKSLGHEFCLYHWCSNGSYCPHPDCSLLHPDQWDSVKDKDVRRVRNTGPKYRPTAQEKER